jgi:hypothetical protein
MTTRKSEAYWEGYREQAAKSAAKRARAAMDAVPDLAALVRDIARDVGRDQGIKRRIFARSPGVFSSMDAAELGAASSRELAARELKELGIEVGDGDPVQLLDVHHAGRDYARNGGRSIAGSASDAAPSSAAQRIIDKYLEG